jgi:hypothetical protein
MGFPKENANFALEQIGTLFTRLIRPKSLDNVIKGSVELQVDGFLVSDVFSRVQRLRGSRRMAILPVDEDVVI